jgi:LCP family protein required for cell wall assembly
LNTDTLIMIRIPNSGGRAVGVSMPRDSYVDIPGYGQHKINSAYARAKNTAMERLARQGIADQAQREVQTNVEGAKSLIATVERLTGATIDHYAEVNLLGFHDITLAVGGIEVCLKEPVNDKLSGARFPAGRQTLSGAAALAFVRQRHGLPNGDLDRIVRQQVFMSGMAHKVFSTGMLSPESDTLDKLRQAVQKSVVLDRGWNVIQFAQQMMSFTGGNLDFKTIPVGNPALQTPYDGDAVEVSPLAVRAFVKGLLAGDATPASGAVPAPPDTWSPQDITVEVRNASGRAGIANQVSASLAGKGFRMGATGNATIRTTSVVRFRTGEQANGERVAAELGGIAAEPDGNVAKGHVTVLLGKDFDLEAGSQLAGKPLLALHPLSQQPAGPGTEGCVY